jgi:hypothetical protein
MYIKYHKQVAEFLSVARCASSPLVPINAGVTPERQKSLVTKLLEVTFRVCHPFGTRWLRVEVLRQ